MKTILICGPQGSGKTKLANNFSHARWMSTFRLKFADPLYAMHKALLPLLEEYGLREKDSDTKDGELLQVLGTEYGRKKYGPNVWADITRRRVQEQSTAYEYAVIDDCRFRTEFDAFPMGLKVWLNCPMEVRKGRAEYWRDNTEHPSERDLDLYVEEKRFDLVINTEKNTAEETLKELFRAIERKWPSVY